MKSFLFSAEELLLHVSVIYTSESLFIGLFVSFDGAGTGKQVIHCS